MKWINYNSRLYLQGQVLFSLKEFRSISLSERVSIKKSSIVFWEEHYFRLMASMRIMKISIPMGYTPDYLEEQVLSVVKKNSLKEGVIEFLFLKEGQREVSFLLSVVDLAPSPCFLESPYNLDFFKEYKIPPKFLNQLSFCNLPEKDLAKVYIEEYHLDDVIFLNTHNRIIQSLNGFVFLIKKMCVLTPKIPEGCLKGVIREKFIGFLNKTKEYEVTETEIFPYELQSTDELFLLQDLNFCSVSNLRQKKYINSISKKIYIAWEAYLLKEVENSLTP